MSSFTTMRQGCRTISRRLKAPGRGLSSIIWRAPKRQAAANSEGFLAVLRAVERGKTWVKISGGFRIEPDGYAATIASKLLRHVGPQRLMWGSDWPFAAFEDRMSYWKAIADYRGYVPDASIRRSIDRTALAFYFS